MKDLPLLTVVPAGAGSGKTHSIQERLAEWVAADQIQPERIIAVTFTDAAASELRGRIRARLLKDGQPDKALRLDQAYISTIHSFGLRLLTEFAFEAGMSSHPRLLNEDEEKALVRRAVAQSGKSEELIDDLSLYGYKFDFNSKKGPEDIFRDDVLEVANRLRQIGWQIDGQSLAKPALDYISSLYGTVGDANILNDQLADAVEALLREFPNDLASLFPDNNAARNALRNDYRALNLVRDKEKRETDWSLWQKLRSMRLSKRGAALPEGYDDLAESVIAAADQLQHHPGPLSQAIIKTDALITTGEAVLGRYAAAKLESGLLDYSDMVTLAWQLLGESRETIDALRQRVDCIVIDEFQDTNPIQFALLWQLHKLGIPAVIVGDLKQAIMGFQGADSRLFAQVEQQHPEQCSPLTKNWRSAPPLMAFINAMGEGLFGDQHQSLTPQAPDTDLKPLEVINFPDNIKKGAHQVRAYAVASRCLELLADENQQVVDRYSKINRRLRAGDIAVLCPTHKMLAQYADVFRGLGMRVQIDQDGWYESRPVQILLHALQYAFNPDDRHAALYLAVTELGSLSLEDALGALLISDTLNEPLLDCIEQTVGGLEELTIDQIVSQVIAALNIHEVLASWPDAEQARANVLRLEAEAVDFVAANRETLASGGYYGTEIPTFLAWLAGQVDDDDAQPQARVVDANAITLATWHSSKGREWPVVVVGGMDREYKPRLPDFEVSNADFSRLDTILDNAWIRYSPNFAAPESQARYLEPLHAEAEEAARRLIYVALTRAREKLIIEWPSFQAGKDKLSYWNLLSPRCGITLEDDGLHFNDAIYPCVVSVNRVKNSDDLNIPPPQKVTELPRLGRRAILDRAMPTILTRDIITAREHLPSAVDSLAIKTSSYGTALTIQSNLPPKELGSALHRCFEVLPLKPMAAENMGLWSGIDTNDDTNAAIIDSVLAFESWVATRWPSAIIHREWPILAKIPNGSVLSVVADVVVQSADGLWILDHKSDRTEDIAERLEYYYPQLMAYADALNTITDLPPVRGVGINWIQHASVSQVEL